MRKFKHDHEVGLNILFWWIVCTARRSWHELKTRFNPFVWSQVFRAEPLHTSAKHALETGKIAEQNLTVCRRKTAISFSRRITLAPVPQNCFLDRPRTTIMQKPLDLTIINFTQPLSKSP